MKFSIYRYNPETNIKPYMQDCELTEDKIESGMKLLDALLLLKAQDETLSFRRSCGEGVCGSDGMNINGRNGLACVTALDDLEQPVVIRPMPGMPVIRDLIVDLEPFYRQYRSVKPYLMNKDPMPEVERLQSPDQREQLNGYYECILCGCCSTACPSFWWNTDTFLGPAALLQSWRFLADNRDQATDERLADLDGPNRLFRCHSIMNCVDVCPKSLNPKRAIGLIKDKMLKRSL
ncbi:MAG: succinate dehydrogenase iron-sulfur subunit [Gammaproteobacteria bacterium]|nr:succinate dehydrogenase iron-sulfur subunit [Gammaproteobacteria bacterium]